MPPAPPATNREPSVATNMGEENDEGNEDVLETWRQSEDQLRFTFDQKPKDIQEGWVFGSNPRKCDVILGSAKDGISGSHFRITFDDQKRLCLIDQSTNGTAVSYNGEGEYKIRNDFKWILFPEIENKTVVINGPGSNLPLVEFSVDVVDPDSLSCPDGYTKLRDAFLDEMCHSSETVKSETVKSETVKSETVKSENVKSENE